MLQMLQGEQGVLIHVRFVYPFLIQYFHSLKFYAAPPYNQLCNLEINETEWFGVGLHADICLSPYLTA